MTKGLYLGSFALIFLVTGTLGNAGKDKYKCDETGPGYASPEAAMKGPREKLLYVPCIQPPGSNKTGYLATIDADPKSPTYSKVIHRLHVLHPEDELHHSGWNFCSSSYKDPTRKRSHLIFPCMMGDRLYFVNTIHDPKAPKIDKVIEGSLLREKHNIGAFHTSHCLASGEIMISSMGDGQGNAQGTFLLLDAKTFEIKGLWSEKKLPFNYDYWYQHRKDVMISTEWAEPNTFRNGFNPAHIKEGKYGQSINVWKWKSREFVKSINLTSAGWIPLEIRFLHNPDASVGFVASALSGNVFRIFKTEGDEWDAESVISIESLPVKNWALPDMPALITDILISMDDKCLFMSDWLHGDIRMYDITDTKNPKLRAQLWLGGSIIKGGGVTVTKPGYEQPPPRYIKGVKVEGGPQMLQLSLDGLRLYVTTSLFSIWDEQFYPNLVKKGAVLVLIDVDHKKGTLKINEDFFVNFGAEPNGPVLAHEIRYPGGDCSSEIFY